MDSDGRWDRILTARRATWITGCDVLSVMVKILLALAASGTLLADVSVAHADGPWRDSAIGVPETGSQLSRTVEPGETFALTGGQLRYAGWTCGGDPFQICVLLVKAMHEQTVSVEDLVSRHNWVGLSPVWSPQRVLENLKDERWFWRGDNCGRPAGCDRARVAFFEDTRLVETRVLTSPPPPPPETNCERLALDPGHLIRATGLEIFIVASGCTRRWVPNPETLTEITTRYSQGVIPIAEWAMSSLARRPDVPDVNRDSAGFRQAMVDIFGVWRGAIPDAPEAPEMHGELPLEGIAGRSFSEPERAFISWLLSNLPPWFHTQPALVGIVRADKPPNGDCSAKGRYYYARTGPDRERRVFIYDRGTGGACSADSSTPGQDLQRFKDTLIHELTHAAQAYVRETGQVLTVNDNLALNPVVHDYAAAFWDCGGVLAFVLAADCVPRSPWKLWEVSSLYGLLNGPIEEMAEAVVDYVLTPDGLRRESRTRYDFLKTRLFDGREYGE